MPDSGGDDELDVLASRQTGAKREDSGAAIGEELEHLDRVAEIEVEDFVGCKDVHLGEGSRLQQVVDGGADGARAARKLDSLTGGVGLAEEAALDRVRFEP